MKASVHLLTGCVALGLTLPTNLSQAAAPLAGSFAITNASVGQFGFGKSENRREADDLLKDARQAMKEGKYDQAGDLIAKADKLGVKYNSLTDRWADTPEKLRKLLADEQAKAGKPQRPSSMFPASAANAPSGKQEAQSQVPAGPFSGQNQEAAMDRITDEAKVKALSFADQGRKALTRGDLPGAKAFYQKAIAHQATFGPGDYSPQRLGADLSAKGVEISQLKPASNDPTSGFAQRPQDAVPGAGDQIPSLGPARLPVGGEEVTNPYQLTADKNQLTRSPEESIYGAPPSTIGNEKYGVRRASGTVTDDVPDSYPVARGSYDPAKDNSRLAPAALSQDEGSSRLTPVGPVSPGVALYQEGIKALENRDRETALAKFNKAWKFQAQLDPDTRKLLQGKLQDLSGPAARPAPVAADGALSPLEQVGSHQEVLRQKLVREVSTEQKAAEKLAITDPKGALANLKKVREKITGAEVEPAARKQLLTLVDRSINELANWIEQNKATLENKEHNAEVRNGVERDRESTIEMQTKLAQLVEQFNKLIDERRYAEAEIIAKQAHEIAPENPVTALLVEKSKFAKQIAFNEDNKARKEAAYMGAMNSLEDSSEPFDDREPIRWMDVTKWDQISKLRKRMIGDLRKMSPQEMEIQKSLSKQVEVKFEGQTLSQVMDTLSKMTGVNIHLNPNALHSEGITSDQPVSLNLTQPVSLKSALTLILEPMQLGYVVRNEVLDVVSKNSKDANTYAQVYYVADLVIPIPNFVPSYNMGLPGALRESLNSLGYGGGGGFGPGRAMAANGSAPLGIAANDQSQASQTVNPLVLAQQAGVTPPGGGRGNMPISGPGGMGGGVVADFDSLIELITTTIDPDSWDEVGGPGSIAEFATNLSLVISQTQETHEKIDRLLAQLREIQDEQVTIEVRFITLSDRFFERIGIDFDFNIDDNSGLNSIANILIPPRGTLDDGGPSVAFGLTPNGTPTPTLDLEFKQGSFGSTRPQFGNFDPNTAATFGFAILSDIEAFFLLEAAQGDDRTNVLQAPKVTLFNGQQAFVSDTSQRPFVISVIPVVGDFAVGHQPVIVVLNEGTSLSVQAVISADRRFCRLTLVPFFSTIGNVDTFTFNGSVTTNTGTTVQDPTDAKKTVVQGGTTTVQGTTVQLPTFAFTSVITTVSVPDGGTVLLGGIKRLREGRNERGVPILSKVPYVSRLFRNVGIGRDAQSLMMMVTPRIIIQKEEEAKLGLNTDSP